MKIMYDENNKYYLLNDIIIIDIESSILCCKLKNKSNNCLKLVNNIWYYNNYKTCTKLVEILFPEKKIISFKCINNNINDYRKENIEFKYDNKFYDNFKEPTDYIIIAKGTSHQILYGKFSGQYRNMYWEVKDKNNEIYFIMHITNNIYTKFSKKDHDKVINYKDVRPFWYLNNNGYIGTTINNTIDRNIIYLHQYIMDVHNEDLTNYEKTVDHINRDKLDNRKENLRFANMSLQNENRNKSARRCDAKTQLPELYKILPLYVQYRQEIYNKKNNMMREFFIIDHPKLDKIWESSKSIKISLSEKFKSVKLKLELIDNVITMKQYNMESGLNIILDLPIGIRLHNNQFIYDYKNKNNRYNIKRTIHSKDIQNELDCIINDINTKYPDINYMKYTIKNLDAISHIAKNINIIEKKSKLS